jgi:hypothetical protein
MVNTAEELSELADPSKKVGLLDRIELQAMVAAVTDNEGVRRRAARHALGTFRFMLIRSRISDAALTATLQMREVVIALTGKEPTGRGSVGWRPVLAARWDRQGNAVRKGFSELLRHIFGNPFRPYPAPPSWPAAVVSLAEAVYNGADATFALHDALLEAGHPELAAHFQAEQSHPKGCWAVDMIIGKC